MDTMRKEFLEHFDVIKRFILFGEPSLLLQFIDKVFGDLDQFRRNVNIFDWQKIYTDLINENELFCDGKEQNLKCEFSVFGLRSQLHRMLDVFDHKYPNELTISEFRASECFYVTYKVPSLLSYLFDSFTLKKYQLLFKVRFICMAIERQLAKNMSYGPDNYQSSSISLRCNMQIFFECVLKHLTNAVENSLKLFMENVNKARSMDELSAHHTNFLDELMCKFLMEDLEIFRRFMNISDRCIGYIRFLLTYDPNEDFSIQLTEFKSSFRLNVQLLAEELKKWDDLINDKYFYDFHELDGLVTKFTEITTAVSYFELCEMACSMLNAHAVNQ